MRFFRNVFSLPKTIIENKKLLASLAKNDFKTKFAGSYLGTIWAFIQPIVTIFVYWFAFEKGLKANAISISDGIQVPYVVWLTAGMVPWFFIQEGLMGGTNALIEYSYLVKKVVFQIDIIPMVKLLSSFFIHVFFVVFAIVFLAFHGMYPDLYYLQVIYYSFALFVLLVGFIYFTSAVVIFFRDLGQMVSIFLQVAIWMTPIMWNVETIDINQKLIFVLKLNPFHYIVQGYRDSLIYKNWFWENPGLTIWYWAFTIIFLLIGINAFKRLKPHFADVL